MSDRFFDSLGTADYSSIRVPDGYSCCECGAAGCKLWRPYQTFAVRLRCLPCVIKDGDATVSNHRLHSIGWNVAAIPTVEGDTYWGYTSSPQDAVDWWDRLPFHATHYRGVRTCVS